MLHPSYSDLMKVVNDQAEDDTPVVNSRYSIVMATAKRARQIIAGESSCTEEEREKPLSTAVRELNEGSLRIVEAEFEEDDIIEKLALADAGGMMLSGDSDGEAGAEDSEEDEDEGDDTE